MKSMQSKCLQKRLEFELLQLTLLLQTCLLVQWFIKLNMLHCFKASIFTVHTTTGKQHPKFICSGGCLKGPEGQNKRKRCFSNRTVLIQTRFEQLSNQPTTTAAKASMKLLLLATRACTSQYFHPVTSASSAGYTGSSRHHTPQPLPTTHSYSS